MCDQLPRVEPPSEPDDDRIDPTDRNDPQGRLDPTDRRDPAWWERRYLQGDIPWDTGITPPEVVALVGSGLVKRGWALDLGCGSGVTSRYLAAHGFHVVGLDLSQFALSCGAQRAASQSLPCLFVRGSVADLSFLRVSATFAVDVGCFHSLSPEARLTYVRTLVQRVEPRGYYLLYAFVRPPRFTGDAEEAGPAIALTDIAAFAPWFGLRSVSHGEDRGRSSAWFLMQRE